MMKQIWSKISILNKNIPWKNLWQNLSWKAKKHIAESLCAFVVVFTMVVSLWTPIPQESEEEVITAQGSYQMTNDGKTVSLQLDSTQTKKAAEEEAGQDSFAASGSTTEEKREVVSNQRGRNTSTAGSSDSSKTDSTKADTGKPDSTKADVEKTDSAKENDGKTDAEKTDSTKKNDGKTDAEKTDAGKIDSTETDAQSGNLADNKDAGLANEDKGSANTDDIQRNKVVRNGDAQQSSDGRNVVVKNPEPLTLVSTIFENHGTIPDLGEIITKYQFPVELGYTIDKNYDGKQTVKDGILNVVLETTPENSNVKEKTQGGENVSEEPSSEEVIQGDEKASSEEMIQGNGETSAKASSEVKDQSSAIAPEDKTKESGADAEGGTEQERSEEMDEKENSNLTKEQETSPTNDSVQRIMMQTTPVIDPQKSAQEQSSDNKEEEESSADDMENGTKAIETVSSNGKVESEQKTNSESEKEQSGREQFKKEIWSKILPTEPVVVKTEKDLEVEQKKEVNTVKKTEKESAAANYSQEQTSTQAELDDENTGAKSVDSKESEEEQTDSEEDVVQEEKDNDTEDFTDDAPVYETVTSDAGYYIISGKMRSNTNVFISDIQIKPSGVDGFTQVRLGKKGEFKDAIALTEEGMDQSVELYFTDGERITKGTTFTYSKDTVSPVVQVEDTDYKMLTDGSNSIFCSNQPEIQVAINDGESSVGMEQVLAVYGDRITYALEPLEEPKFKLPQDFFGRVLLSAKDKAGNASDIVSKYYLIDQTAPEIHFSDSEVYSAPYTLWVSLEECGHIVSGMDEIECKVNGEVYEISDLTMQENVKLSDTLEVPSKAGFSISFEEEGEYGIEVQVTDHAGNITVSEKTIKVTQPELVAVYMPKQFTIHIDPQQLLGREQIFSDDITLNNVSNVDVKVTIENVELTVKDEMSDTGILKDCELYLVAPDTGEKIKLQKGDNKGIYSYRLPIDAEGDLAGIHFVGETTEGSDTMWEGSDIRMNVKLNFSKWEEE